MKTEVKTVTPLMAKQYLANNEKNRPLNSHRVQILLASMRRGEWKLSPQPIIISRHGRLLDGQHRLAALSLLGSPLTLSVTTGADEDCFDVIDIGKVRNYSDMTGIPQREAVVITALSALYFQRTPTPQQSHSIRDIFLDDIHAIMKVHKGAVKMVTSGSFVGGLAYMAVKNDNLEYVIGVYKKLVKLDMLDISQSMATFYKMYNKYLLKKMYFTKKEIFTIACLLANEKKRDLKSFIYHSKTHINEFRNLTADLLEG
jgi:hypothetical protein